MKKERIKNIILTALVLLSLVLTTKIWFNERLWPDGYSFFSQLKSHFSTLFTAAQSEDATSNLLFPSQMVAYTIKDSDHASYVVTTSNEYYIQTTDCCEKAIDSALQQPQKNISVVDDAAWRNALYTSGMYIDYGNAIPSGVFSALFGRGTQTELTNAISNIRSAIITAEGNLVSDIIVYLRSAEGNCVKISTPEPKTELTNVLSLLSAYVTPSNRFSFFIGADRATSDMGEVLFSPYLLLTETPTQYPNIQAENPLKQQENGLSLSKLEGLLRLFSMNPKTTRRYIDAEENIIFLQNQSTLKISPKGYIEYTAAGGGKGFALKNAASTTNYALESVRLVYDIFFIFTDKRANLYISNYLGDAQQSEISFDYNVNGTKILTNLSGTPAVQMQIQDGYVQRLSMHLRTYILTEETTALPSTYTAIDKLFTTLDTNTKNAIIEDMFIAYYDNGADEIKHPTWFVKIQEENHFHIHEN